MDAPNSSWTPCAADDHYCCSVQEDAFPFQRVSAFITITACTWHSIRVEEHTTTALLKSAEWPILTYMLVARFPFDEAKDVVVASLSLEVDTTVK